MEIKFSQFNGGMSGDISTPAPTKCGIVKHFDIHQSPFRLVPNRSTENDMHDGSTDTGMKQYNLKNFAVGSDGKMYALGHQLAGDATKSWVFYKDTPITASWTVNNAYKSTLAGGASWQDCFIEWQGKFYSFATGKVIRCPLAGTFEDAVLTPGSTITSVAQGMVGADGNLYLPYNNKLIRVNSSGTATDDVCSALPSDMMITSLAPYGSYMAIAMATKTSTNTVDTTKPSKVFIWDYVTTAIFQDVIDFGEGALMVLGNVEGNLVGIMDKNLSTSASITLGLGKGAMVIKTWNGGTVETFKEIVGTQAVTAGRMLRYKVMKDNKLYWVASVPFGTSTSTESTFHLGIWCFGRKDASSNFAVSLDFIEDGVDTSNFYIVAFGNAGNYFFINHSADGSITRTDDAANYTTTSVYETQKFGNSRQKNTLVSTYIETERQPAAGSVTLKYKKNGGSTFRTIFTNAVDDSQFHEANCIETGTTATVTMSIANPCVVTLASHGLIPGDTFTFTTTGALPTGVSANTEYFVILEGLTVDAFEFAATEGGAAIVSTGAQNGVHTLNYVTALGDFRELELQATSIGGTVITGIGFKYEIKDDGTVT